MPIRVTRLGPCPRRTCTSISFQQEGLRCGDQPVSGASVCLRIFRHRMNVDAEYQRGKVWSTAQQALLIDSILRGFAVPTIFVRKVADGGQRLFDVIDGKQRLTAMWHFLSDDIRLLRTSSDLPDLGDLSGKCWSELSASAQDKLQFASITVSTIEEATREEIHEFFLRLQKGEPLNAAERRNAMIGPVRDFVATQLAEHRLWETTGISSRRFGIHEHSAIALALVKAGEPTSLKGADLERLYEDQDFEPDGETARGTLALLDALHKISRSKPRVLRTRWGSCRLGLSAHSGTKMMALCRSRPKSWSSLRALSSYAVMLVPLSPTFRPKWSRFRLVMQRKQKPWSS